MNVVFDFDKTLTRRDTTRPLFFFLARRHHQSPWPYLVYFGLYRIGLWGEHRFKSALVRRYLRGRTVEEMAEAAGEFVATLLTSGLNEQIASDLAGHLDQGDRVFIASANFDFLIEAFGRARGIQEAFFTRLEVADGRYTGEIASPIVKGPEKLRVLEDAFGPDGLDTLKFYGDAEDAAVFARIPNHVIV